MIKIPYVKNVTTNFGFPHNIPGVSYVIVLGVFEKL